MTQLLSSEEERIGKEIVNASFIVHKALGPGLLEKVYEVCLSHELRKAGLNVDRQIDIPIVYDGITFEEGLRLDLLVNSKVIIELKAVDFILTDFEVQLMNYLKSTNLPLGFLINFGPRRVEIRRRVNLINQR